MLKYEIFVILYKYYKNQPKNGSVPVIKTISVRSAKFMHPNYICLNA